MFEATCRPIHAEAQLIHVAVLDVVHGVLVRAVHFFTDPKLHEVTADGHLGEVIFVEEATCFPLHA